MISEYLKCSAISLGIVACALAALFCMDSAWRTALAAITTATVARTAWTVGEWVQRKGY